MADDPYNPITNIRKNVLKVSQTELARICDVRQSTISHWESGVGCPDLLSMQRLRDEIKGKSIRWYDKWFFEPPAPRQD